MKTTNNVKSLGVPLRYTLKRELADRDSIKVYEVVGRGLAAVRGDPPDQQRRRGAAS